MFELISQIPFHFTTSLCSLMDPIYYIYHKLYHIFTDHVGHCHYACFCGWLGARVLEIMPTLLFCFFWFCTFFSVRLLLSIQLFVFINPSSSKNPKQIKTQTHWQERLGLDTCTNNDCV